MPDFIHLHVHSHYSLLDGVAKIDEIVKKTKEYEQPAVALTDHGNMFGAMEFYHAASKAGINPLIGCEFYIAPKTRYDKDKEEKYYHLVLLAQDLTGYRNLLKLASVGYLEGFYYRPRIDREVLRQHKEGLIALTACLAGEIPSLILDENDAGLAESVDWHIDTFGKDRLFLEVQNHAMEEEHKVAKGLIEVARNTGLKLVATNDSHYVAKEDAVLQEIMFATRDKTSLSDPNRFRYQNDLFYLKSPEEMQSLFSELPEALTNTRLVADMCDVNLKQLLEQKHLPQYPLPAGETAEGYLKKQAFAGLNERFGSNPPAEYVERLNIELDTIQTTGFSNYFLVVHDFVHFAKNQGILVGPGRGSAAGALVSYCLSITNVDPIRYALFFERFLNPERVSMPDIDIDFEDSRRDEVKEYIRSAYGYERTADIITFGVLKSRAALTDVGRALDVPLEKVRGITKRIDNAQANMPLKTLIEGDDKNSAIPELADLFTNGTPEDKQWIEYSMRLDGTIRQVGTHASGVIISDTNLNEIIPLYKDPKNDIISTQFEYNYLEENGLLKMDILGLATLTLIRDCTERIRHNHHAVIDWDKIPLDDQKVYQLFWKGNTMGIFQFESAGMTEYLKQLRPNCIDDLIAMNALYRPGPMDNIPSYIKRKQGKEAVDCFHADLEPILQPTYGIIVYQEQVMQIGQVLAGFSLGKADVVRRMMAKKKPDDLAKIRPEWIQGAVSRGYSQELAETLFDLLVPFSNYAFNKSHSAAYSIVAYQTAYLKTYYTVEFMAALLTLNRDKSDDVKNYVAECGQLGIQVLPPDINRSLWEFKEEGNSILFGFGAIKGMGEGFTQTLLHVRDLGGVFTSFNDFIDRMLEYEDFKKNAVEILLKAGCFDTLLEAEGQDLLQEKSILLANIDNIINQKQKHKKEQEIGQMGLFGDPENGGFQVHIDRQVPPLTLQEEFENEVEIFGFYLSGKIFENFSQKFNIVNDYSDSLKNNLKDGTGIFLWGYISDVIIKVSGKNSEFAIFTFDTGKEIYRFYLFDNFKDKKLSRFRNFLIKHSFLCLRITISATPNKGNQYEIGDMRPLTSAHQERFTQLHIYIGSNSHPDQMKQSLETLRGMVKQPENRGQLRLVFHSLRDYCPDRVICSEEFNVNPSPGFVKQVKSLPGVKGVWMF